MKAIEQADWPHHKYFEQWFEWLVDPPESSWQKYTEQSFREMQLQNKSSEPID
jgi:predicted ATPase